MKKILACMLAYVLILLSGCGGYRESDVMKTLGDKESKAPLRICVDMGDVVLENKGLNDLIYRLKNTVGIENVVIEVIPPYDVSSSVERKTVLTRIRTEIMAGNGPDVFIMRYEPYWKIDAYGLMENDFEGTDCLFRYPEKAMGNGLFLPLDEYIENHAEFTEWDKLTQSVLDAGRNEEGQQIIPLNYSFPVLCYPKSEYEHIPDKKYTWNDMLTNSELLPYSLDLANCGFSSGGSWAYFQSYIHRVIGELADYESESLSFTEEELLARMNEIMALERVDVYEKIDTAQELNAGPLLSVQRFNKLMTFMPLYNADGGITAHVETFAAVNRNTNRPEEAFRVLDLLMSKDMQCDGPLYREIIRMDTLPMHEDIFRESAPYNFDKYMTSENFDAFCKVREQITAATFRSEITVMLEEMMSKCYQAERYGKTVEEIVHETYKHMERRIKE